MDISLKGIKHINIKYSRQIELALICAYVYQVPMLEYLYYTVPYEPRVHNDNYVNSDSVCLCYQL